MARNLAAVLVGLSLRQSLLRLEIRPSALRLDGAPYLSIMVNVRSLDRSDSDAYTLRHPVRALVWLNLLA